jgi:PsbP-like protein
MKKLLLAFPIIALLAAGCNSSQQASNQNPAQTPVVQNTNQVPTPTPTPTPNSNKTYTNSAFHFSMQYPNDWFMVVEQPEYENGVFIAPAGCGGNSFNACRSGIFNFSNYKNVSVYKDHSPGNTVAIPKDFTDVTVIVFQTDVTFDQFFQKDSLCTNDKNVTQTNINLNGTPAIECRGLQTGGTTGNVPVNIVYLTQSNKVYEISYLYNQSNPNTKVATQIANSFKLNQ